MPDSLILVLMVLPWLFAARCYDRSRVAEAIGLKWRAHYYKQEEIAVFWERRWRRDVGRVSLPQGTAAAEVAEVRWRGEMDAPDAATMALFVIRDDLEGEA